jgi:phosphatidylserine decarboxylase
VSKYGYDVVGAVLFFCLLGIIASWVFTEGRVVRYGVTTILTAGVVFTLYFFRDPDRVIPSDEAAVLAPADGKIVLIKDLHDDEYLKGDAVQISIFMSPLNVHVNRFPIAGEVTYFRHFPGEFLVAFDEKSSTRNERTHIGIENGSCRVLFKQIAGFIARRIVAEVHEGDKVAAGDRFGMIKFGSRLDILIPKTADVKVRLGEKTVAGETILARILPEGKHA